MRLFAILNVLLMSACATSTAPLYGWRATLQGVDAMAYDDDNVHIDFAVKHESLAFNLVNKTDAIIKLDWDAFSFIDLSGQSRRVIHNGTGYANGNQPQVVTQLMPHGKISDALVPAERVFFVPGYTDEYSTHPGHWSAGPLLLEPGQKYALISPGYTNPKRDAYDGRTFGLFMPIIVGEQRTDHTFMFETRAVCTKRCE